MDKKFNNHLEADAHNWDTRELPDKKLSEEIAEWLLNDSESGLKIGVGNAEWLADQLLALIKQAGYVKRVDVLREILTIEQTNPLILMEWLKSQISILGKEVKPMTEEKLPKELPVMAALPVPDAERREKALGYAEVLIKHYEDRIAG